MNDHRRCRLSVSGDETELAGPPVALRALGVLLRDSSEPISVAIIGGSVAQETTSGPLLISMHRGTALHFSGGRDFLDIIWNALQGVAEDAESADSRGVNRHQHVEYYPGDEHRSSDSIPLTILADWPEEA